MTVVDLQPDVDDVLQAEDPAGAEPTVKVQQQGPVRTQALPRKAGVTLSRTVGTTTPVRLVGADHRRASVVVNAANDIWIAFSKAGIQSAIDNPASNQAFKFYGSAQPPITIDATVEVWVLAASSQGLVSILTELWATGD